MAARIPAKPLVKDLEAEAVDVLEYSAACPNSCGYKVVAQKQPAKKCYMLVWQAGENMRFDEGVFVCTAGTIIAAQAQARDNLLSHLQSCCYDYETSNWVDAATGTAIDIDTLIDWIDTINTAAKSKNPNTYGISSSYKHYRCQQCDWQVHAEVLRQDEMRLFSLTETLADGRFASHHHITIRQAAGGLASLIAEHSTKHSDEGLAA